ncbi:MAG TPA: glycoside hydrolase family 18 protein [Polyangiaceae bacterium]|nr:glycoside hydrolase family 18 protein [Polyangiaceae bacterium]
MRLFALSFLSLIPVLACSSSSDEPIGGAGRAGAGGRPDDAAADVGVGGNGRGDAGSTGGAGGGSGATSDASSDGARADGVGPRDDAARPDGSGGQPPIDAGVGGGSGVGGAGGAGGTDGGSGAGGRAGAGGGGAGADGGGSGGAGGAAGTGGAGGGAGSAGSGAGGTGGSGGGGAGERRVVGYFAAWGVYGRSYFVKNIESSGSAARMTHINYGFANISADLKCAIGDSFADYDQAYDATKSVDGTADTWDAGVLRGSFNQLKQLKAKHPGLKVLISVGGWTWSDKFSDAALTPESRRTLVKSCVDMYIKGAFAAGLSHPGVFDGIDIDWEYPAVMGNSSNFRPEDTVNFTALLAEFRAQLDAQGAADGHKYLLTIAAPAGKDKYAKIEIGKIHSSLDFVNVMTYDMHGAWETITNFHAPLAASAADPTSALEYDTDHAMQGWLAGGTPPSKLVMGLPFYGRGWKGVAAGPAGDGLYQTATGGGAQGTYEAGIEDYKVLKMLGAVYKPFRHAETRSFWVFNPTDGVFWSYDDPTAIGDKTSYIKSKGLGGAMFWELSGDDPSGTLITAVSDGLK